MCKWKFYAFQPHFTVTEAGPWWNGGPITHFGSVNQTALDTSHLNSLTFYNQFLSICS